MNPAEKTMNESPPSVPQDPVAVRGVIHGKVIELETQPDLRDGETVEVRIRVVSNTPRTGEGILKTAGVLGRDPRDDETLNYLHDLRKLKLVPTMPPLERVSVSKVGGKPSAAEPFDPSIRISSSSVHGGFPCPCSP